MNMPPQVGDKEDWPNPEILALIQGVVEAAVRRMCLPEERDDSMQNALVRYWQLSQQNPGKQPSWYLLRCRGFVQDKLREGTSLDSPKRRAQACSLDSPDLNNAPTVPELTSDLDPAKLVAVLDALKEMRGRFNKRENAILNLLMDGYGTRQAAKFLRLSPSSVSKQNRRIRSVASQIGFCR